MDLAFAAMERRQLEMWGEGSGGDMMRGCCLAMDQPLCLRSDSTCTEPLFAGGWS